MVPFVWMKYFGRQRLENQSLKVIHLWLEVETAHTLGYKVCFACVCVYVYTCVHDWIHEPLSYKPEQRTGKTQSVWCFWGSMGTLDTISRTHIHIGGCR